jgi:hypothetical protein
MRSLARAISTSPPILDLGDAIELLHAAAGALAHGQLRAATCGALALAAYGDPRETRDADFAVAGVTADRAARALAEAGLEVAIEFAAIRFGGNLVSRIAVSTRAGLSSVDLVTPRSCELAERLVDRAVRAELRGREVAVVSPEDFVILKVLSTRARDLEDARSVLAVRGGELDLRLVAGELDRAAREVGDHDVAGRWRAIEPGRVTG